MSASRRTLLKTTILGPLAALFGRWPKAEAVLPCSDTVPVPVCCGTCENYVPPNRLFNCQLDGEPSAYCRSPKVWCGYPPNIFDVEKYKLYRKPGDRCEHYVRKRDLFGLKDCPPCPDSVAAI